MLHDFYGEPLGQDDFGNEITFLHHFWCKMGLREIQKYNSKGNFDTISTMVVGYVWYSKALFASQWMKLSGHNEADLKKGAGQAYTTMFVASLVMAYVLDWFLIATGKTGWMDGAKIGMIASLGFVVTAFIGDFAFNKKPWSLFWIFAGFQLVSTTIAGAILGMMA